MLAFRNLRPAIYSAAQPLLDHGNAKVREAALVPAIPLAEPPLSLHTETSWLTTPVAC
ncbi:hypothetical protein [Streptomyces sp. NPDC005969]|uniref:hypothetical protein n=1 Tax=Streptomyces sp. NPDC005969 TaxID=3156722 RepID=UPI0033D61786